MIDGGGSPAAGRETLDDEALLTERVMLAVRRREGLSLRSLPDRVAAVVPQLANWGLIDRFGIDGGRIVLTQRGRLMADAVVKELLAAA